METTNQETGIDYKFSSEEKTEGEITTTSMHVIAADNKIGDLYRIIENFMPLVHEEDFRDNHSRAVVLEGYNAGIDYMIEMNSERNSSRKGVDHHVDVKIASGHIDELSPLIETEMRKYETEMARYMPRGKGPLKFGDVI